MSDVMTQPGFDSLGLASPVLDSLRKLGYETPSPIQAQMIPHMLSGRDVIGQAQTGTGKTAAFALPLISRFAHLPPGFVQVLVLAPTRELALQVAEAFGRYGDQYPNMRVVSLCGGMDYRPQLRALRDGVQFVIGTPGRVIDHLTKGSLNLSALSCLVLDEADEMLRMGFIEDVEAVMEATPDSCQVALFSATMPAPIRRLAQKYLENPEEITVKSKTETVSAIRQRYLFVSHRDKFDALTRVLETETFDGVIVFARTKDSTVELADALQDVGYKVSALNGDIPQAQREQTVEQLKNGRIDILVATDVVARGLDVPRISHVINFDIPFDAETYVHRIGRTGRAGREGDAILFVTPKDKRLLQTIERVTRQKVEEMPLPDAAKINEVREQRFMTQLDVQLERGRLEPFAELLARYQQERDADPLQMAAALAVMLYKGKPFHVSDKPRAMRTERSERTERAPRENRAGKEVRIETRKRRDNADGQDRRRAPSEPEQGMVRYRIQVGRKHGVKPSNIVGAIANEASIESRYIGRIEIYPEWSTVDLPEGMPSKVVQHLRKVWVSGQQLNINVDGAPSQKPREKPRAARAR